VLVSVSLAGLAYDSGIAPAHFWMVVLVAFELGYLTPPVAMNHLLARQAVGGEAHVEDEAEQGFFARYLHVLVPMAIMATTLLIVAFGPLLLG
jgi:TRAP-type C4-dicarboxylate transport system permease large subunit